MLLGSTTSLNTGNAPAGVSAAKLKHSRDKFLLVDIREKDEIAAEPLPEDSTADAEETMGRIFHLAKKGALDDWKSSGKTVVLLCNTGHRASLVAAELTANGFDSAVLTRGLVGLRNPAATLPDLVVVLCTKSNPEKITLAINACAVAASNGETVVLVLMSDGVCTFLRKGNNKEAASPTSFRVNDVFVGEPFKPCDALLANFLGTGNAVVLGCTSCCKSRGIEFGSDLLDCVQPMQMPDLLRMLGEAKSNLQFM